MKCAVLLAAALPLLAAASPVFELVARQSKAAGASTVVSDLSLTDSDMKALNKTINENADNQNYGFYQLLTIQSQAQQICYDVGNATGSVNASSAFSSADSSKINTAVVSLKPDIASVLTNLIAHYPAFKNGSVTAPVLSSLNQQRELSRELGNALASKLAKPYNTQAPASMSTILAQFDKAIKVYSG